MQGWIKLHRSIWNNPVVTKDLEHIAIWLWLLCNAQYEDKDIVFGGKRMTLKRGQLITSKRTISERLKVNESKVYRTLNELQSEQQIELQKSRYGSVITILNWDKYQLCEPPIEPQSETKVNHEVNHERTTSEPRVNRNKEVIRSNNNINNINNKQQQQDSTYSGGSGGQRLLSSYLSEHEWELIFKNFDGAVKLIDTVDDLVSEPEKVNNAYRYILGYAKNKNWPKTAEGTRLSL